MRCPQCHFENPEDSLFCGACGSSLEKELICPNCGSKPPTGFKFCNKCGHKLSEPKEGPSEDDLDPLHAMLVICSASAQHSRSHSTTVN